MAPTMTPTRMSAWLDQVWLIRYLDRQLAGEEAQWFEVYAMDRPTLLATIEADTRLRDALAAAASTLHGNVSVDRGGRPGGAPGHDANDGGSASAGSRSAKPVSRGTRQFDLHAGQGRSSTAPAQRLSVHACILLGGNPGDRALAARIAGRTASRRR